MNVPLPLPTTQAKLAIFITLLSILTYMSHKAWTEALTCFTAVELWRGITIQSSFDYEWNIDIYEFGPNALIKKNNPELHNKRVEYFENRNIYGKLLVAEVVIVMAVGTVIAVVAGIFLIYLLVTTIIPATIKTAISIGQRADAEAIQVRENLKLLKRK